MSDRTTLLAPWLLDRPFEWAQHNEAKELQLVLRHYRDDLIVALDRQRDDAAAQLVGAALHRSPNRRTGLAWNQQKPDLYRALARRLFDTAPTETEVGGEDPPPPDPDRAVADAAALAVTYGRHILDLTEADDVNERVKSLERPYGRLGGPPPLRDTLYDALFSCLLGLEQEFVRLDASQRSDVFEFAAQQVLGRLALLEAIAGHSSRLGPAEQDAWTLTGKVMRNHYLVVVPRDGTGLDAKAEPASSPLAERTAHLLARATAEVSLDLVSALVGYSATVYRRAKNAEHSKRRSGAKGQFQGIVEIPFDPKTLESAADEDGDVDPDARELPGRSLGADDTIPGDRGDMEDDPSADAAGAAVAHLADALVGDSDSSGETRGGGVEKTLVALVDAAKQSRDADMVEISRLLQFVQRYHPAPEEWIRATWPSPFRSDDVAWSFCRALWPHTVMWGTASTANDRQRTQMSAIRRALRRLLGEIVATEGRYRP